MTKDLLGSDYYSQESAKAYWSVSQYKRFSECEARALAELQGEWTDQGDKTALLVGNMVHSYFESQEAHQDFMEKHADAMLSKTGKTKGQLKADFKIGEQMIERLRTDQQFMALYQGDKEVSVTGLIGGVEFKGKIDCLNVEKGYFVDIKTTKGPIDNEVWVNIDGQNIKQKWFEAYGYILQMAVYKQMLEDKYGKSFEPIIYAVTKESPSDATAILIQNIDAMQDELSRLAENIGRLDDVKHGRAKAKPCQHCEYCRANRLTQKVMVY